MPVKEDINKDPAQQVLLDAGNAWLHAVQHPGNYTDLVDPNPGPSVNLIERRQNLIKALILKSEANQLTGALKEDKNSKSLGRNSQAIKGARHRDAVLARRNRLEDRAVQYFYDAVGKTAMDGAIAEGKFTYDESEPYYDLWRTSFFHRYGQAGEQFQSARESRIKAFKAEIKMLSEPPTWLPAPKNVDAEVEKDTGLSPDERMNAVIKDHRAGFLTATKMESSQILDMLDYLDNPKYPLGINNKLLEFVHYQHRLNRKFKKEGTPEKATDPNKGPESLVYVLADFLTDASTQLVNLRDLEAQLERSIGRPSLTIEEEAREGLIFIDHPGLVDLVKHRDLKSYAKTGRGVVFEDPTVSLESRFLPPEAGPGRHKFIFDPFNTPRKDDAAKGLIKQAARSMTLGEARKLLREDLTMQQRRQTFIFNILESIASGKSADGSNAPRALKLAIDAADQELRLLEDAGLLA